MVKSVCKYDKFFVLLQRERLRVFFIVHVRVKNQAEQSREVDGADEVADGLM